jgi:hypothetical protein
MEKFHDHGHYWGIEQCWKSGSVREGMGGTGPEYYYYRIIMLISVNVVKSFFLQINTVVMKFGILIFF